MYQALFKNYDDTVLEVLKSHVERLVNDTSHDSHDTSQRCAAEIIAGLIRGSKHWNYDKVSHDDVVVVVVVVVVVAAAVIYLLVVVVVVVVIVVVVIVLVALVSL